MHFWLDLIVLAILAFCAWQGYRRGIIGSILAVLFIVLAVYGANLAASTYSQEFTSMFRPFISGYLDRVEIEAAETVAPPELHRFSTEDLFAREPALEPLVARQIFTDVGVHESRAERLVQQYLAYRDEGLTVNRAMTEVIVHAFCFYLVFLIGFLLIVIGLTVVYNIIPLSFRLPGLKLVDDIGGGVVGFAQGLLLVFMLTWALGYIGLILPEHLLADTWFTELFVRANPMAGFISL